MPSITFFWEQQRKGQAFPAWLQCVGAWVDMCGTEQVVMEGSLVGWQPCVIHCNLLEKLARGGFSGGCTAPPNAQATPELIWRNTTVLEKVLQY